MSSPHDLCPVGTKNFFFCNFFFLVYEQFKPLWRGNYASQRRTGQAQWLTHNRFDWRGRGCRSSWRWRARTTWRGRASSSWRRKDGGRLGDAGIGNNRIKSLGISTFLSVFIQAHFTSLSSMVNSVSSKKESICNNADTDTSPSWTDLACFRRHRRPLRDCF